MQAALASSPAPDDPCSTKRWLFVFSVGGRTGSTTLMGMLNAVPQIKLTGENKDLYSRLYELEQDTLALGGGDRARDEFDAWHNAPDPVRLQAAVCSWLLALSPHPGALVHGFKEIRTPAAPLLARTMPHARFVINFRLDLAAQQRSFERLGGQKTLAEATKGNVSSWRKPIPFVLDDLQRLRAALGGRTVSAWAEYARARSLRRQAKTQRLLALRRCLGAAARARIFVAWVIEHRTRLTRRLSHGAPRRPSHRRSARLRA